MYSGIGIHHMNTTRQHRQDDVSEPPQHVLVLGGAQFGLAVAEYLTGDGQSVTFVSEAFPTAAPDEVTLIHRPLTGANDFRELASELAAIDLVVVVAADAEALLLGYLARRELDPRDVVVGISDPSNEPLFDGTGVDRIDIPRLLAADILDRDT